MSGQGLTGLNALWPLSDKAFNLNLVKAGSAFLNDVFMKVGLGLAIASWAAIGVYLSVPEPPLEILKTKYDLVKREVPAGIPIERLETAVRNQIERIHLLFQRFFGNSSDAGVGR